MLKTVITCVHWSRGDMLNGGRCAIGTEDPVKRAEGFPRTMPGFSECDRCQHYDGPVRLGDRIEAFVKPIARILAPGCLDDAQRVKPESPCGKRKGAINAAMREATGS